MAKQELVDPRSTVSIPDRIKSGTTPVLFTGSRDVETRFWGFFAASIRNLNTRQAYMSACFRFADWCEIRRIALEDVEIMTVSAYIESMCQTHAPATVKQHLSGIRMLFDYLVLHHVLVMNPASSVRGPRNSTKRGKTPVLNIEETRQLFDSIDISSTIGLRDRAIISVMVFSFARVSAVVNMKVADYYTQGRRCYFRLTDKGGKYNEVPAHHTVIEHIDEYLEAAGIAEEPKSPLFRSSNLGGRVRTINDKPMSRHTCLSMIKRRALRAGLPPEICNHTFRGTGITAYLAGGGQLEVAARIADHESTRTTQLYDRRNDEITLDEIERINI